MSIWESTLVPFCLAALQHTLHQSKQKTYMHSHAPLPLSLFLCHSIYLSLSHVPTFPQRAQAALQAVNAMHSGNMGLSGSASSSDGSLMPGQSPVLRIIVENLFYPVSLEVLHQVRTTMPPHPHPPTSESLKTCMWLTRNRISHYSDE